MPKPTDESLRQQTYPHKAPAKPTKKTVLRTFFVEAIGRSGGQALLLCRTTAGPSLQTLSATEKHCMLSCCFRISHSSPTDPQATFPDKAASRSQVLLRAATPAAARCRILWSEAKRPGAKRRASEIRALISRTRLAWIAVRMVLSQESRRLASAHPPKIS